VPDRWSIAQNFEHMVVVEELVLGPIREQLAQAPPPAGSVDCRTIDALIFDKVPDRSIRVKAPEMLEPTGGYIREALVERLLRNYDQLARYVETPGLRDHAVESAPLKVITNGAYTHMDAYQWALTAAAHDERHVCQIIELKADPNYPS